LALNPSVEGDATCAYIKHILPADIAAERIGFGMPIGGSLEYLDPMTIGKALENRKSF
jgi:recombination protein RecR